MPTAYIGMGANLASNAGPPESTLSAAVTRLQSLGRVIARSSIYSTTPVGFSHQPRFLNAVVALETDLSPHALLNNLLAIEKDFGRDRSSSFQNGPRTLDLDVLLFGCIQVNEPGIQIPHPRLAERAFVLIPLHRIAPSAVDPGSGKTVAQLLQILRSKGESDSDAVLEVDSEIWRTGAGRDPDSPNDPPRADPGAPHPHR